MNKCCDTCKHDIGGFCRLNLEYECLSGEGYEASEEESNPIVTLEDLIGVNANEWRFDELYLLSSKRSSPIYGRS